MGDRLEITLVKSTIGYPKRQDRTVRALGLRKIGQTVTHRDTAAVRGMIRVVRHLVEVVERPEEKRRASRRTKAAGEKKPAEKKVKEAASKASAKAPAKKKTAAEGAAEAPAAKKKTPAKGKKTSKAGGGAEKEAGA
jgi:large subunit ribosomal protein L30